MTTTWAWANHGQPVLLTGAFNLPLAKAVASALQLECHVCVKPKFSNGETCVVLPVPVRGCDVFVLQGTAPQANDALMELCLMLQAATLSSAARVTAVIPCFGYARQERKSKPHEPISAKLVADFIQRAGAQRIITIDLHAEAIQGFFTVPVDSLSASNHFVLVIAARFGIDLKAQSDTANMARKESLVIVSPDAGGAKRVRDVANKLGGVSFALIVHAPTRWTKCRLLATSRARRQ